MIDKLDGFSRPRKRYHSEVDEELSLSEYLNARAMELSSSHKKKQVLGCVYVTAIRLLIYHKIGVLTAL